MYARLANVASFLVAVAMNWHRAHRVALPRGLVGVLQSLHLVSRQLSGIGLIRISLHDVEQYLLALPSSGRNVVAHFAHGRSANSGAMPPLLYQRLTLGTQAMQYEYPVPVAVRVNVSWHMLHLIGTSCRSLFSGGVIGACVCLVRKSATSAANAVRSGSDLGNSLFAVSLTLLNLLCSVVLNELMLRQTGEQKTDRRCLHLNCVLHCLQFFSTTLDGRVGGWMYAECVRGMRH